MGYAIGIDLGGSSVKAVATNPLGETTLRRNLSFDADQEMGWAAKIRALVTEIQKEQGEPPSAIGISAPGLAASNGRSIAYMPGRLQGLEGLDWTDYLGGRTPATVLNDAHAALLGEVWLGAAKGYQNAIMLTLGTGVGGAAIVDGKLLRGKIGRAGHMGHTCLDPGGVPDVCGTPGSLEVAIGNYNIRERSGGRFHSTHDVVTAHEAGDSEATAIWLKSVRALACGIVSFINILDPEAVIVGGGIARSGGALFKPLQEYVDQMEWRPGGSRAKILAAELGEFAGAFGSAGHAVPAVRTELERLPAVLRT